jgi:hypothetical protein
MKTSTVLVWLATLVAVLALVAAGAGLFWPGGGGPFTFTTLRGESVQIYGQGLYRHDTLFIGALYRGQDVVMLVVGIPLLVLSALLYRRGSLRGGLLLMGTLAYFLYVYASMALGAAYNPLFLLYIALFSASLFAFVLAFVSLDRQALAARLSGQLPHRPIALFMFICGLLTLAVWLGPLLGSLMQGQPPKFLGSYTTIVTDVLDLGIIVPATFLAGVLLLRRATLGYLVTFALLVIIVILLPGIIASTVSQLAAGVSFTTGEIAGPITGFLLLGLVAGWIVVIFLRPLGAAPTGQPSPWQTSHA